MIKKTAIYVVLMTCLSFAPMQGVSIRGPFTVKNQVLTVPEGGILYVDEIPFGPGDYSFSSEIRSASDIKKMNSFQFASDVKKISSFQWATISLVTCASCIIIYTIKKILEKSNKNKNVHEKKSKKKIIL